MDESTNGNCPICVDPFQVGQQVGGVNIYIQHRNNSNRPQMTNTDYNILPSFETRKLSLFLQLLLPGCDASRLHACCPTCLEGWLSRLKAPHYFLTRTPLELLCPDTAAAPCAGRLLPLWRRRRWAIMEETRLLMMTTPTSSEAMRRSTSVIIHCRYFNFVLMFVILNALALDVCTS